MEIWTVLHQPPSLFKDVFPGASFRLGTPGPLFVQFWPHAASKPQPCHVFRVAVKRPHRSTPRPLIVNYRMYNYTEEPQSTNKSWDWLWHPIRDMKLTFISALNSPHKPKKAPDTKSGHQSKIGEANEHSPRVGFSNNAEVTHSAAVLNFQREMSHLFRKRSSITYTD